MQRRRSRRYLILAFALGALYPFVFPQPGGREGFFRPVWARPVSGAPAPAGVQGVAADPDSQRVSWFRAGHQFGFARLDGELLYTGDLLFGVALSETGFISFPRVGENFIFQDPRGRLLYVAPGYGYPVLDAGGDRLYSISTDLTEFKRLDHEGEALWSAGFFSPITALSLHLEECAVGLLDGTLKLIDREGRIAQEYAPEGSRLPVILGTALSEGHLAVLSGIDPQRLSILERRNGTFVAAAAFNTGSDLRREARLAFTEDGRFLTFELEGGLGLLELKGMQKAELKLAGRLQAVADGPDGLLAVAARGGAGSSLVLLRPLSSPLYSRPLGQAQVFLRFVGRRLLVGLPGRLLRVDYLEG